MLARDKQERMRQEVKSERRRPRDEDREMSVFFRSVLGSHQRNVSRRVTRPVTYRIERGSVYSAWKRSQGPEQNREGQEGAAVALKPLTG